MKKLILFLAIANPALAYDIGSELAVPVHLQSGDLTTLTTDEVVQHGQLLFEAKFTVLDGAGRPKATGSEVPVKSKHAAQQLHVRTSGADSDSCKGCHNDPFPGGAGDFVSNAFSSEGVVHADFTTLDKKFSNERGTTHLFGSGLVELVAREMTAELIELRNGAVQKARTTKTQVTVELKTKGISFGQLHVDERGFIDISDIEGIDFDLIVRPFSQKGVFTSLRQFSVNAMNAHHGMQSEERFGMTWTHEDDFDEDGVANEITRQDMTALVAFQAHLPAPGNKKLTQPELQQAVKNGRESFDRVGCSVCHIPELPISSLLFSEPGPYNNAGTLRPSDDITQVSWQLPNSNLRKGEDGQWYIPMFSDLKRHVIADAAKPYLGNERLSQRFIPNDVFLTARLWGVGSTAPYGHRGDVSTLREIINHHGGEATDARKAYEQLTDFQQAEIIEFLKSLTISGAVL